MEQQTVVLRVSDIGEAEAVNRTAEALQRGAIAVIPTDTVYGLAVHPNAPAGTDGLYLAKSRDRDKPIPFLAADPAAIARTGARLEGAASQLARRFWPGPLTLVLPVPDPSGGQLEEGFRIPDNHLTLAILRSCGGLLRVTSANRSGDPPALTAQAAVDALGDRVAWVLDAGPTRGGTASTVVRFEGTSPTLLREAALSRQQIEEALSADD